MFFVFKLSGNMEMSNGNSNYSVNTSLTSDKITAAGESRHCQKKLRELRMIVADFKNLSPYRAHTLVLHCCSTE